MHKHNSIKFSDTLIWLVAALIPIFLSIYLIKHGEIDLYASGTGYHVILSKYNSTACYFWVVISMLWTFALLFLIALLFSIVKLVKK